MIISGFVIITKFGTWIIIMELALSGSKTKRVIIVYNSYLTETENWWHEIKFCTIPTAVIITFAIVTAV